MWKKISVAFMVPILLAMPVQAVMLPDSCEYAQVNPMCDWAWTNCYFSLMAQILSDDLMDWGW